MPTWVKCRICGEWFDEAVQEAKGQLNDGCCDNCSPYADDYEPVEDEEDE